MSEDGHHCFSGLHLDVLTFLMLFGGSVFSGVCWSFVADMGTQTTQILPSPQVLTSGAWFPCSLQGLVQSLAWLLLPLTLANRLPFLICPRSCLLSLSFPPAHWSLPFKSHRYLRTSLCPLFCWRSFPPAVSEDSLFSCLLYLSA